MTKNKSNSWILLLIAFFVSCLVWYMVVSHMNPDITLHLGASEVNLTNTDANQVGYAYYIEDYSSIKISVEVPQLKAACLGIDDFKLVANVAECKEGLNTVNVDAVLLKNKSVIGNHFSLNHDQITVRAEKLITKDVDVEIEVAGTLGDGLLYGDPILKHSAIKIRVPESLSDKKFIVHGVVDITDEKNTFTNQVALSVKNELGETIDCDELQIYLNQRTVETTVPIGKMNTVSIKLPDPSAYNMEGFCCSGISGDFDTLDVIGPESVVNGLKKIVISSYDLDMDSRTESYSRKLPLKDYLPDQVYVMNRAQKTLHVDISIDELKTDVIRVPAKQVTVSGLSDNENYSIESSEVVVTLAGRESDLKKFKPTDLSLSCSIIGLESGTYYVTPSVTIVTESLRTYCSVKSCNQIRIRVSGS